MTAAAGSDGPGDDLAGRARAESDRLGHGYLADAHFVLALVRDEGPAGQALRAAGVTLDAARALVERILGRGDAKTFRGGPYVASGQRCLESAVVALGKRGDAALGPEHILLGMLDDPGLTGAQGILTVLGVDLGALREDLERRLG